MAPIHGFELIEDREIAELNTRAKLYRHLATGAELLSLENEDENKVFGITFRTPPPDSTGVPHILEHSVLCGSRKYPLKEAFMQLVKGSLNTFINAFTYPDKTCYPVASQNTQDFYNLVDVYLDSVFYPRISPQILQQEGWHFEMENPDVPLSYSGVVFNEMKGAYSTPERALHQSIQSSLYPDTPYAVDSGGDPSVIPQLTYEQFKGFHDAYYHPSNSRIFFYGDDEPEERLRLIDVYLREFERATPDSAIPLQKRFSEPRRVTGAYPAGEDQVAEKKNMVAVNWLLPEGSNPEEVLAFQILEYALVGAPASPLRKALIESGLGEDLTSSGVAAEYREMFFTAGMKGVPAEKALAVESLILETLQRLATDGFDPETIEAAVNTTEFALRENNTGSFPRGIALMLRSLSAWLYDRNPLAPLAFEVPLDSLKARLQGGERLFEQLIQRYLLDNPHRTTVILEPDATLTSRGEQEELQRLASIRASMDEGEVERVIREARELKIAQETPDSPEALATIPRLHLDDLDKEIRQIPLEVGEQDGTKVLYHDLFTNGIAYMDVGLNLHLLPEALLPYVPLFGRALLELGTDEEDFVRLSQRIDRKTGGVHPQTLTTVVRDSPTAAAWLFLRGKVMASQADELLAILGDVLRSAKLDNPERFRQMVLEEKAGMESSLIPAGHRYVNRRLRAHFNEADWATEQMSGITQLMFLRTLAKEVESDWPAVLKRLETIRDLLVNRSALLVNVTVDEENWRSLRPKVDAFLDTLQDSPVFEVAWRREPGEGFEGLTIPSAVNYVGKVADLYQLGYELDGSAMVVARFLGTSWIWEKIRILGGAYGGFSVFDTRAGLYSFLSYRDPNLTATLDAYDQTVEFLRDLELGEEEVSKNIIGVIGDMDTYLLPDAKGYLSMERHLANVTDEERQQLRDEVLSTTLDDFREFSYILERVRDNGIVTVLGSKDAIEAANAKLETPLRIVPVL